MPFSSQVKGELARSMPSKRCCQWTELSTILRLEGTAWRSDDGWEVEVTLGNPTAARKAFILFKHLAKPNARLYLERTQRGQGRRGYRVRIDRAAGEAITLVEAARFGFRPGTVAVPTRRCCQRAAVRAAFLCRGSVTDPERQNHLEIPVDDPAATYFIECFRALRIPIRTTHRRSALVLYMKDGDVIVEFLKQMGAHNALLHLESVRVTKDVRNSINRLVNCETANVDKTVTAAMQQVEAVQRLDRYVGLEKLSPKLQEVATLRARHPYATLQELAEMTSPAISKSTVGYRLRKLMRIAAELPDSQ